jgi:hypothetical protein
MTSARFARIGTAVLTAVILAFGGVIAAAPAQAASTCAWSHGAGGSTCLGTYWTGATTGRSRVSHGDGVGGINLCGYKAQIRGTLYPNGSWSKTSGTYSGCTPVSAWMDITASVTLRHGSLFYGQFYHDKAWAPGSPALTIIN